MYLPRGGILVRTGSADSIDIQFGIPPETIKDSMKLGFKIPSYFVITKEMFDRVTGTSLAEFEFPAYFNFFVLKKPVTIICQHIWTNAIKDIFTETLLGPAEHLQYLDEDYAEGVDEGSKPNWKGEGEYLDAARKTMKVSKKPNTGTRLHAAAHAAHPACRACVCPPLCLHHSIPRSKTSST